LGAKKMLSLKNNDELPVSRELLIDHVKEMVSNLDGLLPISVFLMEKFVWPSSIGMRHTGLARKKLSVNVIWSK